VAFPHVRRPNDNPAAAPAVVVGICRKGTAFGAEDLPPVKLFFLPCTDSEVVHLRLLQKLGRILRLGDSRERLTAAEDAESVMRILIDAEKTFKEQKDNEGNR
jgi:mannitol/fructose-specific phosphotransferase system IIA component (Ntr-type)